MDAAKPILPLCHGQPTAPTVMPHRQHDALVGTLQHDDGLGGFRVAHDVRNQLLCNSKKSPLQLLPDGVRESSLADRQSAIKSRRLPNVIGQPAPSVEILEFNPMGTVHGGWFATLLDSALGCAVHTMMPAGRAYTTAELGIHLVKAITPKVQRVRAIGQVLHLSALRSWPNSSCNSRERRRRSLSSARCSSRLNHCNLV